MGEKTNLKCPSCGLFLFIYFFLTSSVPSPSPPPHSCWDLLSVGLHMDSADRWDFQLFDLILSSADFTESHRGWLSAGAPPPPTPSGLGTRGSPSTVGMAQRGVYVCGCSCISCIVGTTSFSTPFFGGVTPASGQKLLPWCRYCYL